MNKQEKQTAIEELTSEISGSQLAVFASLRGVTTTEINDVRKKAKGEKTALAYVKNTLLKKALEQTGLAVPATAFWKEETVFLRSSNGDPVKVAKLIADWIGLNQKVRIKGAFLVGPKKWLKDAEVIQLAKLPSTKQLQAQVLSALAAPCQNLVGVMHSAVAQIVWVLQMKIKEVSKCP